MTSNPVFITRTASFLPNAPVDNDTMEQVLGQIGARPSRARRTILRSNGIRTRHYAIDPLTRQPTHTNAALTAAAVRQLENEQFNLNEIDCLACGTSIPDQLMPNHAVMVHGELGLPPLEVIATSGVCLSGVSALKYAYMGLAAGIHQRAVATGSELSSAVLNAGNFAGIAANIEGDDQLTKLESNLELAFEKDFLRWMLSDGAGAFLLESQARPDQLNLRIDWIDIFSYADEMDACMYAGAIKNDDGTLTGWSRMPTQQREQQAVFAIQQDVKLLNENIIRYSVEKPLQTIMTKRDLRSENIDYFLPHYSSKFFRERVYAGLRNAGLEIPFERWFTNLERKGNVGSASMYLMVDELFRSGNLRRGQRLLCYVPESGRFSTSFVHLTVV